MKTMKRLLALFLCLVMVCSLVPMQAFATETETDSEIQTTEVPESAAPAVEDSEQESQEEVSGDTQEVTPEDADINAEGEGEEEVPVTYTLTLDPNGGSVEITSIEVTVGQPIGELPVATRASHIFDGWVDADGKKVTAETVYTVAGDSTITAQWIRYPGASSTNVTKELFTIQCTTNEEHKWVVNWAGSHVKLVTNSVKWDEANNRWVAQATFSAFNLINMGTTDDNYFGGMTHHYEDGLKITMDLYYDPNFTGLNSQGKEVTGMWLPVGNYVADVHCYDKPAAPSDATVQKLSKLIRMRDVNNTKNWVRPTKLYAGTYEIGEMYAENGAFYATLTITDLAPYIADFNAKYPGEPEYAVDWLNTTASFTYILKYTGSTTDYKQDGTGWSVDASSYASNTEKSNGKSLWLTRTRYTVTYTDGVEGEEAFADQVYAVAPGAATPAFQGTPERAGYAFKGWTPEVAETVTETEVSYTAKWAPYQTVNVVIYRNGDTTTPYKTVSLDKVPLGDAFDVSALNIADYYSSTYGFEFEGWYNDGGWNSYKAGNKGNTLPEEITINGWTNIVCMVTDYQMVIVYGVTNGDKDNAEVVFNGTALKGLNLVSWLDANVAVPEKTGYTVDKWYNWDWYGHKYDDARTVNGWTNVYVTYTANQYTLTLDPAGGKVDPATVTVTYDAAIGELPAATRSGYIFDGWVDAEGKAVTAETVYTVAGDSTITAQWIRHPGSSSGNVTKELFTIQCDTNGEHKWVVNWLGSHVNLVKDSVKWDEANGRWTAQATFSQFSLMNNSVTRKNYFGGITHHYEDGLKITMDLYYDPNFTGLNSQGKEVTGMWLPVEDYVAHVFCNDKPSMPDVSKVSGNAIWVRDAGNRLAASATRYTIKQLIDGTYTLGEMYTENGKFYVKLTINDLTAYIDALEAKNGKSYAIGNWQYHNTLEDCVFTLVYTGSTTDYKQDGTGWSVDASSYASNSEKMNGKSLWLTEQYTVTYTDGVEDKEVFADQVFVVNLYSENGGTKNDVTDFTLNNVTPTVDDPTRAGYIFNGWNPEVAETITEDATYTAQWIRYPGASSTNVTKELFTIQCTTNEEHKWVVNWAGSHVKLVTNSVKWDEANNRWVAQATFSNFYLINMGTTDDNYFGGMTHHYEDGLKITMDLYYDPNFTGLNSQGKEVTGMWLPVEDYVAHVYCNDKPSMPAVSKISGKALWIRDAGNKNATHSIKYTVKQLIADTYTLGQMYTENGKFYVDMTITDVAPYLAALEAKTGVKYVVGEWEKHYTAADLKFTLEYTGSTTDYKQDGSGWSVKTSSYANTSEKNSGKSLWLTEQYTVTYTDGVDGEEVFADQVFIVNAYTENGATKNAVTDFSATATPTVEDPTRAGYFFRGWTPEVAETVTGDVTYTAVWELIELKVYYTIDGVLVNEFTLTGVDVTAFNVYEYMPEKEGYTLDCWYEKAADIGNPYKAEPNADQDFTYKKVLRLYGSYVANEYTVSYNTNGGPAAESKVVTFGAKYGRLPSSAVTGLSSRKNDWYLVGEDGTVTDVNIRNTTAVSVARDHTLFLMRDVLAPTPKITLTVPGAISDDYKYYVPGASERVLTVTVNNMNEEILSYTYAWYKDDVLIEGATESVLTLPGNVSDSGTYKVVVTATLKDGTGIVVATDTASAEKEQKVQIMHASNTLYYDANGGEGGPSNNFTGGTEITVQSGEPTRVGYTFAGWNTAADGTGDSYVAGDTYTFVDDNGNGGCQVTLYAQWIANEYTVSYNTNGGPAAESKVVTFGAKYGRLPSSAITGLSSRKNDWYLVGEDGTVTDVNIRNTTVVSVARDHTLFLMRDVLAPTPKITLTVPGAISDDYKYYVPGNSTRVLTVTIGNANEEILSYTYAWYKDDVLIEGATESVLTLTGNVSDSGTYKVVVTATLKDGTGIVVNVDTASGEKEQKVQIMHAANTLYYGANGGEGGPSNNFTGGTEITVQSGEPTRVGYTFAGWNTAADGTGDSYVAGDTYTFVDDNGNGGCQVTLYAQWTANTYTVTLDPNGGKIDSTTVEVTYDQPVGELPVPTKEGYTFAGWVDGDGNKVTEETVYTLTDDATLTATWTVNTYTVTLDANGGKVDPASIEVTYGTAIGELPVPTKEGYTFAGWVDKDGNKVTEETVYNLTANATLTAQWTANTYTVTLDPNGGKVDPTAVKATYDAAVGKLPTPTLEGYTFTGWVDKDGNKVTDKTVYSVAGDSILKATWQKTVVKDPTSPDTGDAGITAMLTICALSGALLVILVSQKKRLFR